MIHLPLPLYLRKGGKCRESIFIALAINVLADLIVKLISYWIEKFLKHDSKING